MPTPCARRQLPRLTPGYPDPQVLGKRLGKSMGAVAKAVQDMGAEAILAFEKEGSITLEGHTLVTGEIKVCAGMGVGEGVF